MRSSPGVYKGPSWLDEDQRIVLDYSKTSLAARRIRDEIRSFEPGLYLGLVHRDQHRLMHFALDFTAH